jgi:hypothetical protein
MVRRMTTIYTIGVGFKSWLITLPDVGTQCAETCWSGILNVLHVFEIVHILV